MLPTFSSSNTQTQSLTITEEIDKTSKSNIDPALLNTHKPYHSLLTKEENEIFHRYKRGAVERTPTAISALIHYRNIYSGQDTYTTKQNYDNVSASNSESLPADKNCRKIVLSQAAYGTSFYTVKTTRKCEFKQEKCKVVATHENGLVLHDTTIQCRK